MTQNTNPMTSTFDSSPSDASEPLSPEDLELDAFYMRPELFVDFSATPIAFTVRGARFWKPRFLSVGWPLAAVKTLDDFGAAINAWLDWSIQAKVEEIRIKANATKSINEHQVLLSAMTEGPAELDQKLKRLAHKNRAQLTLLDTGSKPKPKPDADDSSRITE